LCGRLHDVEDAILRSRIDVLLAGFGLAQQRKLRLGSYSKGMRQKVMISAALLHNPNVIILDEPLTGLDVESAMMTKSVLSSLAADGKTVIYSSHVLDVVERLCHRVLIIDQGNVVADGSPDELKSRVEQNSLEAVFRKLTDSGDVEPLVQQIVESLR
jgi:ABC-2 type transport system ATP-binding protein